MRIVLSTLLAVVSLDAASIDFSRDVLPILSDKCFHCHGPDEAQRKAKLRLDTEAGVLREQDRVIVPGKSSESEFVRRVFATDDDLMPPVDSNRKLSAAEKETLKRWIDEGAKWGRHWAFVKPLRPNSPATEDKWVRNDIDQFVLARLEKEGMRPMAEADQRTLIRRVTLDLTGLPPTRGEIQEFVSDKSPNAFVKVVERLLKSPHFGERMAWDWLDIARYADTNGYQGDRTRTMWPWRDWVVAAFNLNMPYDQFTVEQLAGDMLPAATVEQKIATGFNRNHMINGEGGRIAEENRVEYIFDQVETTATTWLGLTMTCSRCHDHKYDPIYLDDYYGLFDIFNRTPVNGAGGNAQMPPIVEAFSDAERKKLGEMGAAIGRIGKEVDEFELALFPRPKGKAAAASEKAAKLSGNIKGELKKTAARRNRRRLGEFKNAFKKSEPIYVELITKLEKAMASRESFSGNLPRVMVMQDTKPRETFVLERGTYNKPGRKVKAQLIGSLHPAPKDAPVNRLTMAKWIVDPENPLTARVTVNRFWQMLFGAGLVRSPEDFGVQGQKPTHPELLDWLAVDFVESGWDVKRLLKQMVTSATYRQSTRAGEEAYANDPDNRLLARAPRFRLPSWMIRDQALAISGLLNRQAGGASVNSYQPTGVWAEATFGKIKYRQDSGDKLYRRSLYLFWRRIVGPTTFFDVAKRQTCEVKPPRTNTPLHALVTMNDITYVEAARVFAEQVMSESESERKRIRIAFSAATGRPPKGVEIELLQKKLSELRSTFTADTKAAGKLASAGERPRNEKLPVTEVAAYTGLCNLILNLDEVVTKE
ncbi:MAG: PSD1 and planctomycete cytochrome C domain-containing protein [Limisphaerales bacterium]